MIVENAKDSYIQDNYDKHCANCQHVKQCWQARGHAMRCLHIGYIQYLCERNDEQISKFLRCGNI